MTQYYKVLGAGLTSYHGGTGKWTVGKWRSVSGVIRPCENGLHFVRAEQLVHWLGPVICPFEPFEGTEIIDAGDKLVCRKGRIGEPLSTWNERTMRLFACDCAERVLANFEERYPEDTRPREAIAVARRYANGEATAEELSAADRAASSAAYSAASSAAYTAYRAAYSAASRAADRAAYSAASRAADRAASRAAYTAYRAASSAAYSAASSAAYTAYRAAYSAASRAAYTAYRAAYSAEREWQTTRLMDILGITAEVSA